MAKHAGGAGLAAMLTGAALLASGLAAHAAGIETQYAVAYQIDRAHSGNMPSPTGAPLAPPLTQAWSRNLGGPISYPLIADGLVLVTVGTPPSSGTRFFAL